MTTYEIRSRYSTHKRFHRDSTTNDARIAEYRVQNMMKYACFAQIKIIVTDDNGIKNVLIVK